MPFFRTLNICLGFAFLLLGEHSVAQPVSNSPLEQEIRKMMNAAGWPHMIEIALSRGDLQRAAKARLGAMSDEQAACIDKQYTQDRVLDRILIGYMQLYSDRKIVSGITRFYESPGGKRILDKVAERSRQIGAAAAHSESKSAASDVLTPEEKAAFAEFASSPSGKAYLELRPTQLRIHQAELAALADEIGRKCRN